MNGRISSLLSPKDCAKILVISVAISDAFQEELMNTLPTSPASCKLALCSPLEIGIGFVICRPGGRHTTVLNNILGLDVAATLLRLAGDLERTASNRWQRETRRQNLHGETSVNKMEKTIIYITLMYPAMGYGM